MNKEEARQRLNELKRTNPKRYYEIRERLEKKFKISNSKTKENIKKGLKNITSQFKLKKYYKLKKSSKKKIGLKEFKEFLTPKIKQFTPQQLKQQVPEIARTRTTLDAPNIHFRNTPEIDKRIQNKNGGKNLFFR